jgi:hypothetical protein
MSRRTPFPFADHHDPEVHSAEHNDLIESFIERYEDALLGEYKSGDIDVASYHEGQREAYETVLVELLGIDPAVMNAYWLRDDEPRHPQPYADELPLLSDPDNWLITYEQVEAWTGKRLTREQWDVLNGAIPNSSVIPDAITIIVNQITEG